MIALIIEMMLFYFMGLTWPKIKISYRYKKNILLRFYEWLDDNVNSFFAFIVLPIVILIDPFIWEKSFISIGKYFQLFGWSVIINSLVCLAFFIGLSFNKEFKNEMPQV